MRTLTLTISVSDDYADKITALPEEKRAQIAADALTAAVNTQTWEFLERSAQEAAKADAALFARWDAEDEAAGVTAEQAEAEWQQLKANLNENRRLAGEEPLF